MMRLFRRTALLSVALLILGARQETSIVDKIIDEGRNRSEVMKHLDHLVNKIGPRLTSSDRLTQACEWAKSKFESFGLKNCRLEEWGTFPVGFNRGPWSGKMTEPEAMALTFTTNSWTPGTDGPSTAEAIVGPANDEELEAMKDKLAGKWVLSPGASTGRDFNNKVREAYDKAGVRGLIRAGERRRDWDVVLTGGSYNVDLEKLPKRCSITLLKPQFDKIKALLGEGKKVVLTFDIKNEFKKGPIPLYNVLAEIPGTEKPKEMVIVGGHIDSWDGATGTTDNGTGTSTTIEAARLLMKAGAKPKRTIRFMLWSGEEQGLFGSRAYVQKHPEENPFISAVLVHDMGTQYVSGVPATKAMKPIFEKVFEPVFKLNPDLPFKINEMNNLPGGGSDHDSYLAVGVPGLFWSQTGDKAWYPRTHHTQLDTYDAAVEEYQKHTAMIVAIGAYGIANLDELLPRDGIRARRPGGFGRRALGVMTGEDGVTITDVTEDTPAERAGLKAGDKILKIGDKEVKDRQSMADAIRESEQKTVVKAKRGDKEMEFKVAFDRTLGITPADETSTSVSDVTPDSPASKAGLKAGDKIVKFDGKEVQDLQALKAAMRDGPKKAKFVVLRGGKEVELEVEFER